MPLSHATGHPILVCLKPDDGLALLFQEAFALAVSLRRPLLAFSLVPKARGAAGVRAVEQELRGLVTAAREVIPNADVDAIVEPLQGPAERRIVTFAEERTCRLIVVGHRARGTKLHIHEPGTTHALVALLGVPLLIVPLPR